MLMRELPCLPLIAERHINAVKSRGVDYKYTDLSLRVFPQVWGKHSSWVWRGWRTGDDSGLHHRCRGHL